MSHLLLKPGFGPVTPEGVLDRCPNWAYVGFDVKTLAAGERYAARTGERELIIVILAGTLLATVDGTPIGELGGRTDVHGREKAWALYVPGGADWEIEAASDLEIALCSAPARGNYPPRVIAPDDGPLEARGKGANTRFFNPICMEERDWAGSLLVTEVWTPAGNWSSYPSHKHDTDDFPNETYLEETYYHRIDPPTGFAVQRVYNDDRSLDETMAVSDGDIVLVPEGYHPCGAIYGHDLYYLNVMAGPRRAWRFRNDPDHDWVFQRDLRD